MVLCVILQSRTLRCRPSYHFIGSLAIARPAWQRHLCLQASWTFTSFTAKTVRTCFCSVGGRDGLVHRVCGKPVPHCHRSIHFYPPPLAYRRIVTRTKAVIAFCMMWVISIIIAVLPLLGWNCKQLNSVCSDIFPLIDENYLMFWISVTTILVIFIIYASLHPLEGAPPHGEDAAAHVSEEPVVHSSDGTKVQTARAGSGSHGHPLGQNAGSDPGGADDLLGASAGHHGVYLFWRMDDNIRQCFAFCTMLCLLNSTVNPIIYALRSKDLRGPSSPPARAAGAPPA